MRVALPRLELEEFVLHMGQRRKHAVMRDVAIMQKHEEPALDMEQRCVSAAMKDTLTMW